MSERRPLLPSLPALNYRRAAAIIGIALLVVVPTGAAFVNSAGLFTGPEEKVLIAPYDGPNSKYVEITADRQLSINLTEANDDLSASGVNPNAQTDFKRLFTVTNTDDEPRKIWATYNNREALTFYVEGTGESLADNVTLAPNETIIVSLRVDTTGDAVDMGSVLTSTLYIGHTEASLPPLNVIPGGPYTVRAGESVGLDVDVGSQTNVTGYAWEIVSGPGTLSGADTASPTYSAPSDIGENATATVEVTVTDELGRTRNATAAVTVVANLPPSADAGGPYEVVAGESIRLDGSGSTDPDGSIAGYDWSIDGDVGRLSNATSARPVFTAPTDITENTTVPVELAVTDDDNATASATTTVTVISNAPPRVEIGGPYTVGANESIDLTGGEFTDPDGDVTDISWNITDGPGSLSGAGTRVPTYTAPDSVTRNTTVTVEVSVTDDAGATTTATTTITVMGNRPPTVDVGGPYTVSAGERIDLAGARVTDPDGNVTDYDWELTSGPGRLTNADSPTPTYIAPAEVSQNQSVTVSLTVTDDDGATETDTGSITVTALNRAPRVGPIGPYSVEIGGQIPLRGLNATDPDGEIASYAWEIVSGPGSLSGAGSARPIYTAPESVDTNRTVQVTVTVTDDDGATTTRTTSIGVYEPGTVPDISVSRLAVDYPHIGKTLEVSRTVTVRNNGSAPLLINETTIVGGGADQFRMVSDLPDQLVLAPGEERTVEVTFDPTEAGAFEPSLRFLSNDPDEPVKDIALQATALPPLIDIDRDQLDFGNVSVGGRETLTLTVSNPEDSPADLTVRSTDIVGRNPGAFEIIGGGAPFTLAPGEEREIRVEYSPQTAGIKIAQLRIRSDADNSQIDVWMSNSDWWVRVNDVTSGSTTTRAKGAQITGNKVPPGVGVAVNTSVPSTEGESAYVQGATVVPNTNVGERANFTINFLHDDRDPPAPGDERFDETTDRRVLEYITVEHDIPNEQISDNSFTVRVHKHNLPTDTVPDEITIRHRVGDEWEDMDAELIAERGNSLIYLVETPGFSQFVVTGPNTPPTADAGDDTTVKPGKTIQLDASGSTDPDGSIVEYDWEITSGPGHLLNPTVQSPSYVVPRSTSPGQTAEIRLTVTDNTGATVSDTVKVRIAGEETPPDNGTPPGGGGGAPGGGGGAGPAPADNESAAGTTPDAGQAPTEPGDTVSEEGVSVQIPGEQELSEVIQISDLGVPESEEAQGPKARITTGRESGGVPAESIDTDEPGVSIAVDQEGVSERLQVKGADTMTLVGDPITLDGSNSLFAAKESIADSWRMVRRVEITVPPEYEDREGTVTISVPRSRFGDTDPEAATIARNADGWQLLATEVVSASDDTVVLRARTPGFSEFAVFASNSVSYSWTVETYDDPLTGQQIDPTFDEPGYYNATLTVTDAFGRSDSTNYTILANDVPEVAINWTGAVPINRTVVLGATVTDEVGNVTLTWKLPDGTEKTGRQINHTFAPGTSGEIVVVAEDEFGAQGRDTVPLGGGGETYQVEILSYNFELDQELLWLLLLLLAVLVLIALARWLVGIAPRRGHPPEIEAFEEPVIDLDEQWVVIPTLEITDEGEDLDAVTVSIVTAVQGAEGERVVGRETGTFGGGDQYIGSSVVISAGPGEQLVQNTEYAVRVQVTDEDGSETVEQHRVSFDSDEWALGDERPGPDAPTSFPIDREPGDD